MTWTSLLVFSCPAGRRAAVAAAAFLRLFLAAAAPAAADPRVTSAVRQATEILAARERVVERLQLRAGVSVHEDGPRTDITLPVQALFGSNDLEAPRTSPLMDDLKDFITTFHTPHLIVSWPLPAAADDDGAAQGARRAVGLGFRLMKECGLAPERLFVRSRQASGSAIRLGISTVRPKPGDLDKEFRPVMVHASGRELTPGKGNLALDVILLDPARIRRWMLVLLAPDGNVVRRFDGGQDVYATLVWDGADSKGRAAAPGVYQAFLTAETWSSEHRTDSLAFVVKRVPAPVAAAPLPAPPAPVPQKAEGRDVAKWFHTVTFAAGEDEVPGKMYLAVEQAARALRLYPGQKVMVEGFCSPAEKGGRKLAQRRAERVREMLVGRHGVMGERVMVKGNAPRAPVEGEVMNKALIFFLE